MNAKIEDYALIGDRRSAALVSRCGSVDWLCWPRFDSDACFAALLGDERHGCWRLAPSGDTGGAATRCYRGDTLILETRHTTRAGAAKVTDLMPLGEKNGAIIRQVAGDRGEVAFTLDLALRFDYGAEAPWLRTAPREIVSVVGPDLVILRADADMRLHDGRVLADFSVKPGQVVSFVLQYGRSYEPPPAALDLAAAISHTEADWQLWARRFNRPTDWPDAVRRSLLTLRALSHRETAGMVAAPTSSLPEIPGGEANWDYRYSWLRDSTFTLCALLNAGYRDEAGAWRDWLLRVAAGAPERLQAIYRCDGARNLDEREIGWLPGYLDARPVRVGNTAAVQFQLDIFGEVLDSLHLVEQAGLHNRRSDIDVARAIVAHLERVWRHPDKGMWESREAPQNFTYSKVMAWVGIDRFLKSEQMSRDPDRDRHRQLEALRDQIHHEICRDGFNPSRGCFVSAFGADHVDASLLMLPLVGFLPATDLRIGSTIAAIERDLVEDGLVYRKGSAIGSPEGAFIPCTCWLADCLGMQGRDREARAYLERVLALRNDVGLLAEEWDPRTGHMLGNFPQALSHLAVVNTALGLCGPVLQRGGG
ncbi:MAG TPA: glycoside hydrolase family 15 protein [Stellaceae bacterium]|jgi:GH15 family glucan-1,4-alpha-glucosidase